MAQLKAEQYIAIEWLSIPRKGDKTFEEVAEICGVHVNTLKQWRKDKSFDTELKRAMVRNNSDKLPELIESLATIAMRDGNAAMAKLAFQVNDMLTDRVAVDTNVPEITDVDELQKRIAALQKPKE